MHVIIQVEGGLVRSCTVNGETITAEVHDYDIEGTIDDTLTDDDGTEYAVYTT